MENSIRIFVALAALLVVASSSCSNDIDREFGPSSLHGSGQLPGVVVTTAAPTGL